MSKRHQEVIDRYLRDEASLEEGLAAFREYMDSSGDAGLSMGWGGLSPEQRSRLEVLVGRWSEIRKQEVDRLLAEARKAGREVAEITFRDARRGKTDSGGAS
jgi:hypothetical protein